MLSSLTSLSASVSLSGTWSDLSLKETDVTSYKKPSNGFSSHLENKKYLLYPKRLFNSRPLPTAQTHLLSSTPPLEASCRSQKYTVCSFPYYFLCIDLCIVYSIIQISAHMLSRLTVVIMPQYTQISNHYAIHLQLILL